MQCVSTSAAKKIGGSASDITGCFIFETVSILETFSVE
jgi:hypothetical protein